MLLKIFLISALSLGLISNEKDLVFSLNSQEWRDLHMEQVADKLSRANMSLGKSEFRNLLQPIHNIKKLKSRISKIKALSELDDVEFLINITEQSALLESNILKFFDDPANPGGQISLYYQLTMSAAASFGLISSIWYNKHRIRDGFEKPHGDNILSRSLYWFQWTLESTVAPAFSVYMLWESLSSTYLRVFKAQQQIKQLCKLLDLYQQARKSVGDLFDLESPSQDLIRVLKEPWLIQTPRAQAALLKFKPETHMMLKELANLDAYLSATWLFLKEDYKFVEFLENNNTKIIFELLGAKNPLINLDDSVENDFILGDKNSPESHWLLTGPHACGKTTALRTIGQIFVLAQSIGLVPARKAKITPVKNIKTYMNIIDNISENKSSFQAEYSRMQEFENLIDNNYNNKILMLIDEPYAKTVPETGNELLVRFLEKIQNSSNLTVLLASHFNEPAQIAKKSSNIKNMQPEINSNLAPTYKIKNGSADWWFEDKLRRWAFIQKNIL